MLLYFILIIFFCSALLSSFVSGDIQIHIVIVIVNITEKTSVRVHKHVFVWTVDR